VIVNEDVANPDDGHGLDASAERAVALAESEARQFGHDRVGTEHLLLGLLTNDSAASHMLSDAGVTLTAARNKVIEAVGISSRRNPDELTRSLPRTARATRALGRSVRFAHARGSDVVTSDHVLMGVLDVEGIAGQVLRGLGVDVESLRGSLDALVQESPPGRDESRNDDPGVFRSAMCPSCNASLDHELVYRVVRAAGEDGHTRDALLFSCGVCGRFLAAGPA
jgi:ATP-dependent Clp protease ATP-binding subunit ClpA